jgi:hypothetical protein
MGATRVNPSQNLSEKHSRSQCKHIHTQQQQIFEKMTRIESQLDTNNIVN